MEYYVEDYCELLSFINWATFMLHHHGVQAVFPKSFYRNSSCWPDQSLPEVGVIFWCRWMAYTFWRSYRHVIWNKGFSYGFSRRNSPLWLVGVDGFLHPLLNWGDVNIICLPLYITLYVTYYIYLIDMRNTYFWSTFTSTLHIFVSIWHLYISISFLICVNT